MLGESRSTMVLVSILAGLRFPADRWQVLAHVDHYGADPGTRHLFWDLPERNYPTAASVLAALGVSVPGGAPGGPHRGQNQHGQNQHGQNVCAGQGPRVGRNHSPGEPGEPGEMVG